MRFNVPPNWPPQPPGWAPTQGWRPPVQWPTPPLAWAFWSDDEGRQVLGPPGFYASKAPAPTTRTRRVTTLAGASLGMAVLATAGALVAVDAGEDPNAAGDVAARGPVMPSTLARTDPTGARMPRCDVKAVVTANGTRVALVPGDPAYATAVVDPRDGERWFCDARQASRAGWRLAHR